MDNRPIGIFDSGLGGLTAVKALRRLMPEENIIYFGDTGRMPYGGRSVEQLRRMTHQDLAFIGSFGVKAVIAACGTVSSNAGDILESYSLPVVGVLKAGTEALARTGGQDRAAVIATLASIDSGSFARAFAQAAPGRALMSVACPALVPLIESGHTAADDPALLAALEEYLRPIQEAGVSALLLGCTHYGIIRSAVAAVLGPDVALVGASESAAREMRALLTDDHRTGGEGREEYYTSGSVDAFTAAASAFLGRGIEGRVMQAPLMEV